MGFHEPHEPQGAHEAREAREAHEAHEPHEAHVYPRIVPNAPNPSTRTSLSGFALAN